MGTKMILSTLNHNIPDLTDNLIDQLKRDSVTDDMEIMVVDNGSSEPLAKYTTHTLEHNVFFGGGFNVILDYFLSTDHEYLAMMNNDLIFHGYNFVSNVLNEMKEADSSVYSPSIINSEIAQCNWKQMYNWGSGTVREVRWIDFQCPILRRDICEIIGQFPDTLGYGWGLDFYTGVMCDIHGLKTHVSDKQTIAHLNSQTFRRNKINIGVEEFCARAEAGLHEYFSNSEHWNLYLELRGYGEKYVYA